jgi:hypothetical protein
MEDILRVVLQKKPSARVEWSGGKCGDVELTAVDSKSVAD